MVSKSSAPHSIRFKNDLWAWLVDEAKAAGVTPNEWLVDVVEARRRGTEAKGPVKAKRPAEKIAAGLNDAIEIAQGRADPKTYRVHVPLVTEVQRKPYQKGQKK